MTKNNEINPISLEYKKRNALLNSLFCAIANLILDIHKEPIPPKKEEILPNEEFQNKLIEGFLSQDLQEKEMSLVELAKMRNSFVEIIPGKTIDYPEKNLQVQSLNFDLDKASYPVGFVISPIKNKSELKNLETFDPNKEFKVLSFNAFNIGGSLIDKSEIWQKIDRQNPEVICINGINLEAPNQSEIKKLTDLGYTIYFNYMSNGVFGNLIAIKNPDQVKLKLRIPPEGFSYSSYPTQQVLENMIKDKAMLMYTQLILEFENNLAIGTNYISPFSDSLQRFKNVKQIANYSQGKKVAFPGVHNFYGSDAIYRDPYKRSLMNANSNKEITEVINFLAQEYPNFKYLPDNSQFQLNSVIHKKSPSIEEKIENLQERIAVEYLDIKLDGALVSVKIEQTESTTLPNFQHPIQLFTVLPN